MTEDDLRIISLTPFFSKTFEQIVLDWLLVYVSDQLDPFQYGGRKGSSINHYLIDLISFILLNQDLPETRAVLATMVDFSKAFNRQNHHILITKLSDMGVPGWLLKIVIGFLKERKLIVTHNGAASGTKDMPGGGPQGTVLGMTNLRDPHQPGWACKPKQETGRDRHELTLPKDSNQIQAQLDRLCNYADENQMRLNNRVDRQSMTCVKNNSTSNFCSLSGTQERIQ